MNAVQRCEGSLCLGGVVHSRAYLHSNRLKAGLIEKVSLHLRPLVLSLDLMVLARKAQGFVGSQGSQVTRPFQMTELTHLTHLKKEFGWKWLQSIRKPREDNHGSAFM